jgi:hypothetical protein
MILREIAPTRHLPGRISYQAEDRPIVATTFGTMMELRCVIAVIPFSIKIYNLQDYFIL